MLISASGGALQFGGLQDPATNAIGDLDDTQPKACYDQQALMRRYEVIAELMGYIGDLGWGPYQADHEDANGQFEINWECAQFRSRSPSHHVPYQPCASRVAMRISAPCLKSVARTQSRLIRGFTPAHRSTGPRSALSVSLHRGLATAISEIVLTLTFKFLINIFLYLFDVGIG